MRMTPCQEQAIKCAYADLKGALECYKKGAYGEHDWKAHKLTIQELEEEFYFLTEKEV
jgi:hypothetical protein